MRALTLLSTIAVLALAEPHLEQSTFLTLQLTQPNTYSFSYFSTISLGNNRPTTPFTLLLDTRSLYTTLFDAGCKACTNKNKYVRPADRAPFYDNEMPADIKNLEVTSVYPTELKAGLNSLESSFFKAAIVTESSNLRSIYLQDGLLSFGRRVTKTGTET